MLPLARRWSTCRPYHAGYTAETRPKLFSCKRVVIGTRRCWLSERHTVSFCSGRGVHWQGQVQGSRESSEMAFQGSGKATICGLWPVKISHVFSNTSMPSRSAREAPN